MKLYNVNMALKLCKTFLQHGTKFFPPQKPFSFSLIPHIVYWRVVYHILTRIYMKNVRSRHHTLLYIS